MKKEDHDEVAVQLCHSAKRGQLANVQRLLECNANPNSRDRGQTALGFATEQGAWECVQAILDANADVNAVDTYNQTALHWGARNRTKRCIYALVSFGCDSKIPNWMGETAEDIAKLFADQDIIRAIIWKKLPPGALPEKGIPSKEPEVVYIDMAKQRLELDNVELCSAIFNSDATTVRKLLDAGASSNAIWRGQPALSHACASDNVECAQMLLDAGADVNTLDTYGQSAYHWVARRSAVECCKLLLMHGIDRDIVNWMGEKAEDIVEAKNNLEMIKVVIHGIGLPKKDGLGEADSVCDTSALEHARANHKMGDVDYDSVILEQEVEHKVVANIKPRFLDDDGRVIRQCAEDLGQLRRAARHLEGLEEREMRSPI
mmetsp:Transcript_78021/g.137633  ORF Transcript_78021/g.137633 Transcript_78021/m.137633 type:complete len:375 (-) Transcript_78021:220-1344(-)